MEIERKWHMKKEPELPVRSHTRMEQSYLSVYPEVRIRKYENLTKGEQAKYDLTIKSEGTLAREEVIKELTEEEYFILLGILDGLEPIIKDHRTYNYNGYILEYSVVDPDRDSRFSYAEVEFPSLEEADVFDAPEWFGTETTEQKNFKMKKYWQATRLK